jgi:hypothetical protein
VGPREGLREGLELGLFEVGPREGLREGLELGLREGLGLHDASSSPRGRTRAELRRAGARASSLHSVAFSTVKAAHAGACKHARAHGKYGKSPAGENAANTGAASNLAE